MSEARFPVHRTRIAGLEVRDLASRFGTPLFIYDAATIRERIASLRAFDVIRYAQKANSTIGVLELCRAEGAVVDAVSAGECLRALRAGYSPAEVVYTADIFDRPSLDLVVERGFPVNCGSHDMIRQLGERAPGREITLRINPGFGHGHSQKVNTGGEQSKHGIWHEQIAECVEIARSVGLTVSGVHTHIGSGVDMEHLERVAHAVCDFARSVGDSVHTISAGGGLSVPYRDGEPRIDTDGYFATWDRARAELARDLGHDVSLEIEPGRYLVAESGFLVSEIRAIKRMGSKTYYLVDAGFNNLARPVLYGAYHPISIAVDDGTPCHDVVVAGPLCESGDIFTQTDGGFVETRSLPEASVGDLLTLECAGAYAASMGSNYNSKPLAAEVLVDGGAARLIRARQGLESMWGDEAANAAATNSPE